MATLFKTCLQGPTIMALGLGRFDVEALEVRVVQRQVGRDVGLSFRFQLPCKLANLVCHCTNPPFSEQLAAAALGLELAAFLLRNMLTTAFCSCRARLL